MTVERGNIGPLLQVGDPHEVYARPADVFVARFIGSPSINILAGTVRAEESDLVVEVAGEGNGAGRLARRLSGASQIKRERGPGEIEFATGGRGALLKSGAEESHPLPTEGHFGDERASDRRCR